MSKAELLALPRIVEKDGTMSVINKPGWIWFNLLEMKWFSFILLFAIIYAITFITFAGLFHLFNMSHTEDDQSNITNSDCYVGVNTLPLTSCSPWRPDMRYYADAADMSA